MAGDVHASEQRDVTGHVRNLPALVRRPRRWRRVAVQAEGAQVDGGRRAVGQVGQELAEQWPELESVPARAAADDDPPGPGQDEVVVGGVVVDATLRVHGIGVQGGQQTADGAGQQGEEPGIVVRRCRAGGVVAGEVGARGVMGDLVGSARAPPSGTGRP